MRAITVWQPWASLIAAGVKRYEFRGWPPPRPLRGRRIAIHAGARAVRKGEVIALILRLRSDDAWMTGLDPEALPLLARIREAPRAVPLSHVVCTAVLGEPFRASELAGVPVNDSDRRQHSQWAWPLTAIQPVEPPAPAAGMQGFWEWTA